MTDAVDFVESPPAMEEGDGPRDMMASDQASANDNDNAAASANRNDGASERGLLPTIRTRLFGRRPWSRSSDDSDGNSFLRPHLLRNYGSIATIDTYDSRDGFGGPYQDDAGSGTVTPHGVLGDAVTDGLLGGAGHTSNTAWLAKRHGVKHDKYMYVACPNSTWPLQISMLLRSRTHAI